MNTEELIDQLGADLQPSRSPLPVWVRFVGWALASIGVGSMIVTYGTMEYRLELLFASPLNLLEGLSVVLIAGLAAFGALLSSIPGRDNRLYTFTSMALALGVWMLLVVARYLLTEGTFMSSDGFLRGAMCSYNILSFALLPGLLLFCMMRVSSPTQLAKSGALIAIAAFASGAFLVEFRCHGADFTHIFFWHFGSVVLASGVGAIVGVRALRW